MEANIHDQTPAIEVVLENGVFKKLIVNTKSRGWLRVKIDRGPGPQGGAVHFHIPPETIKELGAGDGGL